MNLVKHSDLYPINVFLGYFCFGFGILLTYFEATFVLLLIDKLENEEAEEEEEEFQWNYFVFP